MNLIKIKTIILFLVFLNVSCNINQSANVQKSLIGTTQQSKEYDKIPLKVKTIENDNVIQIIISADEVDFAIYYLKNKETSYFKLSKSNNYISVDFCINSTSLEDAKNQIQLFKKELFYYLMIPTCTQELPMFNVIKFDNISYFKDLDIYGFKYNEDIFKLGKFEDIKYSIIDDNSEIRIIGTLSRQEFYLSNIIKFENKEKIKVKDLEYINEISSNNLKQNICSDKYIANFIATIKTEATTTGMASLTYNFLISNDEADLKMISYHEPLNCEGKYKIIEKNEILEIYYNGQADYCINGKPNFILKKNGNKYFIKGLDGEAIFNEWIKIKK